MTSQNHLADETSPYLLQHADNPVDWHPWNDRALTLARDQTRPILLSIGYSACHWCHVMAHESFEDPDIAALMNARFVNIKVDREERPDLDRVYQLAHQVLTRRGGGWPLTVVLDPNTLAPFFAGTYFPRQARYGMLGFADVLNRIGDWFAAHRDELAGQDESLRQVFAQIDPTPAPDAEFGPAPLAEARAQLMQQFDPEYGGFSPAPKFPHPETVAFLLRDWGRSRGTGADADERPLHMAVTTLRGMARGGLLDQVGGGFSRYSVDERWEIPHFEKMLYDNGPLLAVYCEALRIRPEPLFRRAAEATADWVLREMQAPEGGYYASLDADSEGEEGRFYTWNQDQVRALAGDDADIAMRHFGLDRPPNFEGRWHLTARTGAAALSEAFDQPEDTVRERLAYARLALFRSRENRVRPGRDDKVLTAWNGLMIRGMATAARILERPDCLTSAQRALDFVRDRMWRDGRLLATWKDGRARFNAYLDDHAFLLDATLALLQTDWRDEDLVFARALAERLLDGFEDPEHGGFFFTSHDHEALLHRPKPLADESLPSGNGVTARALLQLGHLLGEPRYLDAAERVLRLAWSALGAQPAAYPTVLDVLQSHLRPPEIVLLRGDAHTISEWRHAVDAFYAPDRLVFAIPAGARELPPAIADRKPPNGAGALAYVCQGATCSTPISSLNGLLERMA